MKLDEVVSWYQKKIGTYDKQQWEKTVEQKILDGFSSSVTLKNAKLKTELIDVDLVRGSTFPKAKPKQKLLTVIRLAILRYLFLPLYARWWVKQTSSNVFILILCLYVTQMMNWSIYTFNVNRVELNNYNSTGAIATNNGTNEYSTVVRQNEEHVVSLSELIIPMALSLLISLIHSQIVATNTATSGTKNNRRRCSNTTLNGKQVRDTRVRRRRKFVKIRNQDLTDATTVTTSNSVLQKRQLIAAKANQDALDIVYTLPLEPCKQNSSNAFTNDASNSQITQSIDTNEESNRINSISALKNANTYSNGAQPPASSATLKLDLKNVTMDNGLTENPLKKRNVNWHSPLHNYATNTHEKQQQTSPQETATVLTSESSSSSSTSSSSSSSTATTSNNSVVNTPINDGTTKHLDKLKCSKDQLTQPISTATIAPPPPPPPTARVVYNARRTVGEDDGFESLNGKSSSGEETHSPRLHHNSNNNSAPVITTSSNLTANSSHLRLRLNVGAAAAGCEKKTQISLGTNANASSGETDEEGDDGDIISSPASTCNNECTTSATEWLGITTNSEECSYSSDLDHSDNYNKTHQSDEESYDMDFMPATILNAYGTTDRVSCTIWDHRDIKKAQLSVLEISSCIIDRVDSMGETNDYIYFGICFSIMLSFIPTFCRLCEVTIDADKSHEISYFDLPMLLWEKASFSFGTIFHFAFGNTQWERTVIIIGFVQRLLLTLILFIIFAVAERTFKQRFLYAKLFSHLTSSRRARKSNLPHFRLNKVRNIKTWLSVRSYLKKRGPQRSVDIIVSAAFIVTLLLLAFLSVEWLKDSVHLHSHLNLEALMWSITIGIFLLRYMTLGNKIHHKYRSVSVLITEQINLYLQIEQKPKKKDELMVSNSVLKLAADLLKELESPFKISGLSANPYLFTTIKVVILSALSGVLSEVLGFKLKLHKIKIK